MRLSRTKIALLPVVAAALMACGGGSGSDGGGGALPESITLDGTVAKGVVSGAKIRVLSASADGTVLASGVVTGTDGRYSIQLNKPSGPVVIEADLEGADIADELNPGRTYKGQRGDKIRAILPPVTSSGATANVTPFSEMAVDIVAEAGWNAAAITDANQVVRRLLNNTDHLTADPTKGEFLISLTAVQKLINDIGSVEALGVVLQTLRDAADGRSGNVSIDPQVVEVLVAACTTQCDNAFNTPGTPVPIGTGDKINPVYALFQDLRDTLYAYSNSTKTGELDAAGVRVNQALKDATQPVDDEMLGVLAMFQAGDRLFREFNEDGGALTVNKGSVWGRVSTFNTSGAAVGSSWLPRYQCHVAKATLITTASGELDFDPNSTYNTNPAAGTANLFSCDGIGTIGRLYPARDGINSFWHRTTFIPQEDGSVKYVHQLRTRPFDLTGTAGGSTRVPSRAAYGSLTVNRDNVGELTGFALNGKLVPGLKGHAAGEYATLDRVDAALSFVSSAPSSSSMRFDMSGSMKLYKKEQALPASSVEIASGSFAEAKTDVPFTYQDYVFGGSSCPAGYVSTGGSVPFLWCVGTLTGTTAEIGQLKLDVSIAAPGVKFQGIINANTPSFDKSQTAYVPTKVSLQGKLFEADGDGYRLLLDGLGTVDVLNFAQYDNSVPFSDPAMDVTFNGKVLLKDRPEMALALSVSQAASTASGNGARTLSSTFTWNNKALKLTVDANGAATVSNDSGVRFTVPKGGADNNQDVFLGNDKVGVVNIGKRRIDYVDGRFQQF